MTTCGCVSSHGGGAWRLRRASARRAPALTTCRRDATAVVVQEEFDKVVAERGMAAKLNRLDALLESRELVEGQTL